MFTLNLILFMLTSFLSGDQDPPINVLGGKLEACCYKPMTGYYRDGYCNTGPSDYGIHVVCAVMTDEFLNYSSSCGNDLITPNPRYNFPGLKAGDQWCLCAVRWKEAQEAGIACPVILESTHKNALKIIELETLKKYAIAKSK